MRRIHEAKLAGAPEVVIWGSGRPLREFLHVDGNLADALVFMMRAPGGVEMVNVGSGAEVAIARHRRESSLA